MHIYRKVKETINYFHERYFSEEGAKELINTRDELSKVQEENNKLQKYAHDITKKYEAVNEKLSIYETEKQKSLEQVYKLQEQNNHLRYLQSSYLEKINNQAKDLSRLTVLTEYYSTSRYDFKYDHRKHILTICDRLKEMTQFLLDKMLHFFPDKDFPFLWKGVYDGLNDHTFTVCHCMNDAHEKCIYTNNYAH